ncbi:GDSL-type esterase/lipase family protein [Eubacterium xylanophilum]|uniref:GDSL-type esterase/lipase family protein n=1 Tax=Eubacterium xylanophilum TaxID=39497 RepID=UPI00047CDDEC|nr:GDSL-type esterase/lipase family protein [Eubacterium xylanophilum]
MNKNLKNGLAGALALAMVVTSVTAPEVNAAKKAKLKTKKVTLKVGKKKAIVIKNKVKKAKYSFKSSNKKVATVSKKGLIKAVKKGTAKIKVTEKKGSKKKSIGTVKVVVKSNASAKAAETATPVSTTPAAKTSEAPTVAPTVAPTATASVVPSVEPTVAPTAAPTEKVIANETINPDTSAAFRVYKEMTSEYAPNNPDIEFQPTATDWENMISASLVSTGNNARVKSVIDKARAGQDVTLAYIGGSITEGEGAKPTNDFCYAQLSASFFASKYGTGNNVKFINAGQSGTPSALGIIRYDNDVIKRNDGKTPDILFIEFAVNDSGECTKGGAMDGLIRRAIKAGSAVVLVMSVFKAHNVVLGNEYKKIGAHYDLPVVSVADGIEDYYTETEFTDWYYNDAYHPKTAGHELMARSIINLIDAIDKEAPEADNLADIDNFPAYKTPTYADIVNLEPATLQDCLENHSDIFKSVDRGSFVSTFGNSGVYHFNQKRQKFATNWMHDKGDGDAVFEANLHCKNILLAYNIANNASFGTVEVLVDDKVVKTVKGYESGGWNQAGTVSILEEDEAADHNLKIRMKSGDEEKQFVMYGIGVD